MEERRKENVEHGFCYDIIDSGEEAEKKGRGKRKQKSCWAMTVLKLM